ncbi:hypothetical protein BC940DRAFT_320317 [Gongronella butleri]|nr:hypothetical protein BC940DRAFT_320317 [Gongronella butleri]
MQLIFAVLILFASWCLCQECVPQKPDYEIFDSAVSIGLSYAGGFNAYTSLAVSAFTFGLQKIKETGEYKEAPSELAQLAAKLERKIDQSEDRAAINTFKTFLNQYEAFMEIYTDHIKYEDDLGPFFATQLPNMYRVSASIIGSNTEHINSLGLPMIGTMGFLHLAVLRDAFFFTPRKRKWSEQYQKNLDRYTNYMASAFERKVKNLTETTNKPLHALNDLLTYETAMIMNGWDVAAKWTITLPLDYTADLDIVYTRPVYSEATDCNAPGWKSCDMDPKNFNMNRHRDPAYHGALVELGYNAVGYWKGPGWRPTRGTRLPTEATAFTGFRLKLEDGTVYDTQPGMDGKPTVKIVNQTSVGITYTRHDARFTNLYLRYPPPEQCEAGDCWRKPSLFRFGKDVIGKVMDDERGKTDLCTFPEVEQHAPSGHVMTRILPGQDPKRLQVNRWVFEYRKANQRVTFDGVKNNHAIRFPGDWLLYKAKDKSGAKLGALHYLMGGYAIEGTVTFDLPAQTTHVRVYSTNLGPVPGCELKPLKYTFGRFTLYEGPCAQPSITVSGYIGAIEAILIHPNEQDTLKPSEAAAIAQEVAAEQAMGTGVQTTNTQTGSGQAIGATKQKPKKGKWKAPGSHNVGRSR